MCANIAYKAKLRRKIVGKKNKRDLRMLKVEFEENKKVFLRIVQKRIQINEF